MDIAGLQNAILHSEKSQFDALAMEVFKYQSEHCSVYRQYLQHLQLSPSNIQNPADIPYLPIEFFKNFEIKTGNFKEDIVFESSSTGGIGISRHFVRDRNWYEKVFTSCFRSNFGDESEYCHLALLPSYLERKNSSLVFQVSRFISNSRYNQSAFFLDKKEELFKVLQKNESDGIPGILWGVSFALLDFAEEFQLPLKHTSILETGGMKGRRKEITRQELHENLQSAFHSISILGEYGMTELMSQAYSLKNGLFQTMPWMKVTCREINDPFSQIAYRKHGAINIADLANLDSCAFIATSDLGKVYEDGSFEILGRIDHSDTRGCNLLV